MATFSTGLNSIEFETDQLLFEWGRWSRSGVNLGDGSSPIFRELLGSTLPTIMMSDDLGLKINAAVASYGKVDKKGQRALIYYYTRGLKREEISRKIGVHHRAVYPLIRRGVNFMCGAIYQWGNYESR